jgi:hypothetical protein
MNMTTTRQTAGIRGHDKETKAAISSKRRESK